MKINHNKIIITLDGTAASGKGTIAKLVAKRLDFDYLDSGLIYRELAYQLHKNDLLDIDKQVEFSKNFNLNDINNHLKDLKTEEIGKLASEVSAVPEIRANLIDIQRKFAANSSKDGIVTDGRDMGTVIFTGANFKFFVTADIKVRAERRFKELQLINKNVIYDQVAQDLIDRDKRDKNRKCSPLKPAEGAIILDTSELSPDEATDIIISYVLD